MARLSELHAVAREVRAGSQPGVPSARPSDATPTASAWRRALGRRVLALGLALIGETSSPALRATR